MSKSIEFPDIGIVNIAKNSKSKRISIVLKPHKGIRVVIPAWATYNQAIKVVNNKKEWILTNLEKIKIIENRTAIFNESEGFKTRNHQLILKRDGVEKPIAKIVGNEIIIKYPYHLQTNNTEVQQVIRKGIEMALKKEAKAYLPERISYLANYFGFKFNKLALRNSKTRWGSCSAKNNINLSVHLMKLPDYLIDFVILHELVHTKVKNHSKYFWDTLGKVSGDVKKLRKDLKKYHITIF